MDQEFGHPAVDFGQTAVDQLTGMSTQKTTRVKKRSANTTRSLTSQPAEFSASWLNYGGTYG